MKLKKPQGLAVDRRPKGLNVFDSFIGIHPELNRKNKVFISGELIEAYVVQQG